MRSSLAIAAVAMAGLAISVSLAITDASATAWPQASVMGRLTIPTLHVSVAVGNCPRACTFAASQKVLDRETMWWPDTPARPDSGGVYAIAGHDVTPVPGFGAHGPFHYLYRLKVGAPVYLRWGGRTARYRVTAVRTLSVADKGGLGPARGERLVLSTCWPPGSSSHRMYAYAVRVA
jgi:LPXTG-site transpeptidase (sortase) family protein